MRQSDDDDGGHDDDDDDDDINGNSNYGDMPAITAMIMTLTVSTKMAGDALIYDSNDNVISGSGSKKGGDVRR